MDPNDIISFLSSSHEHVPSEVSAFLSTTLSTAVPAIAHGHENPLFGPPDPYLAAGKSIAPSAKALMDMGITPAKTVGEMIPDASEGLKQAVATAASKGYNILDGSKITLTGANHLPGFQETRGIFGSRMQPFDTPATFAAEMQWASGYFNVMDKLPFVAFYFALLEFFILRPGVDLYKEDIEEDPEGVMADTISVGIVRVSAFALIAFLTVLFSG